MPKQTTKPPCEIADDKEKIFNIWIRKLECANERAVTLIDKRISQLQYYIKQIEENIDGRAVDQR